MKYCLNFLSLQIYTFIFLYFVFLYTIPKNTTHNTHIIGSVRTTPVYFITGITKTQDNTFTPNSILLDNTGAILYPIACIALRKTNRLPNGKKNIVQTFRLNAALLIIFWLFVQIRIRINVLPKTNAINIDIIDQINSPHNTCFIASFILSNCLAPKFCPTKVEFAVAMVESGIINIS